MSNGDQKQECAPGVPVVGCAIAFQRIEDKLDTIIESNKALKEVVYGNGKRGLRERVHDVELFIGTAKWVIAIGALVFVTQFFELLLKLFRGGT